MVCTTSLSPSDLRHHYFKTRIIQSLRTKSPSQARYVSQKLASRLDDYWINLRLREVEIPAAHLLRSIPVRKSIHYSLPLMMR